MEKLYIVKIESQRKDIAKLKEINSELYEALKELLDGTEKLINGAIVLKPMRDAARTALANADKNK